MSVLLGAVGGAVAGATAMYKLMKQASAPRQIVVVEPEKKSKDPWLPPPPAWKRDGRSSDDWPDINMDNKLF